MDVDRYLERIGFAAEPRVDLETLAALQLAHLTTVPFENLHVYHKVGVRTDTEWSVAKIVEHGRGGWCFEANGAFAELLEELGFHVARLGAAVLLGGPNDMVDHLTLEVVLDQPYLVDVGFGVSFIVPLLLNEAGPQDGGSGTFEFIPSSRGLTLTQHVDGVPSPQYRFRRVNHQMTDFDPASEYLQSNTELQWSRGPFATRLIDHGPDRVTLLSDRLKFVRGGEVSETPVEPDNWEATLQEWFGMGLPEESK